MSAAPDTAAWYRRFAAAELRGQSPCYEAWTNGIAASPDLIALIDASPPAKRQPNLILGAARFLGAEPGPFATFHAWLVDHWPAVRAVALARHTQTNEAGRCAVLLPLLAALPQPLALIEAGAAAGLCLYPDRYSYRYGDRALDPPPGPSPVVLPCAVSGPVPVPAALPEIVWRAGIDRNPLDVTDADAMAWLEALVWPEQQHRRDRLRAAIAIARADPPRLTAGDIVERLAETVAAAPKGATVVVFHSAVLPYLPAEARARFVAAVRRLPCRWIANESPDALPVPPGRLPPPPGDALHFLVTLDGDPVAYAGSHGQSLHWLNPS